MKTAYISYSRSDRAIAASVANAILQHGIRPILDYTASVAGENFAEQLIESLQSSDL